MISILDDIRKIKSGRKELREFGITIGAVLLALSGVALWRGKASYAYLLISGSLSIGLGVIAPVILTPFQKAWMVFSVVVGFFMSRAILAVLFYAVMTPIGLLARLFGNDMLSQRISKDSPSYWRALPAAAKAKESYENQY